MSAASTQPAPGGASSGGRLARWWDSISDQFGFRQAVSEYLIPVETNSVWYSLGGVLAIALGLEIATGFLLSLVYVPDAGLAYDNVVHLLQTPGWAIVVNFHYYTAYLIFALVMIHMVRVFISGGYRAGKEGLWLVGVGLAGLTFVISTTGEALHWDEVGFAVPWHVSEILQAVGLASFFGYTFEALKNIPTATEKLSQIYATHVSIVAIALGAFIAWHYVLIRFKGISVPFWLRASGRSASFTEHLKAWAIYSGIILGIVLLIAIFLPRDPGTAPQLLASSPLYGSEHGPGGLGYKPTFPISWTHGMNIFVAEWLGIEPDIWGTIIGMALMLGSLLVIPFIDRGDRAPSTRAEAFDWRRRGWAFAAFALFWVVMVVGVVQNAVAGPG
jgi:quinol-cytochrome oxidoreductase complex cytochrome b subunit